MPQQQVTGDRLRNADFSASSGKMTSDLELKGGDLCVLCCISLEWNFHLAELGAGCSGGQGGDLIQIPQTVLSKF